MCPASFHALLRSLLSAVLLGLCIASCMGIDYFLSLVFQSVWLYSILIYIWAIPRFQSVFIELLWISVWCSCMDIPPHTPRKLLRSGVPGPEAEHMLSCIRVHRVFSSASPAACVRESCSVSLLLWVDLEKTAFLIVVGKHLIVVLLWISLKVKWWLEMFCIFSNILFLFNIQMWGYRVFLEAETLEHLLLCFWFYPLKLLLQSRKEIVLWGGGESSLWFSCRNVI